MKTLLTITNPEDIGVEAVVLENLMTGKFHAVLRDTDENETVGVVICPSFEMARSKAHGMVGMKEAA